VLDDVGSFAWRLFSRFVGGQDEPQAIVRAGPAPPVRPRSAPGVSVAAE
jgi:hypothetical protein